MEKKIEIENLGTLRVFKNNIIDKWTFMLGSEKFELLSKNNYRLKREDGTDIKITIMGNNFSGFKIKVNDEIYQITERIPWYCYIFIVATFACGVTLGNISGFAESGIYFVGGLLGGAIGGFMAAAGLVVSTLNLKWYIKLLLLITILIATVFILLGVGTAIVSAIKK